MLLMMYSCKILIINNLKKEYQDEIGVLISPLVKRILHE